MFDEIRLEPVKDVPLVQLGGLPEIAAAMSKRTVPPRHFRSRWLTSHNKAGAHLANLAKENIPFLHVDITTTRKFMRERRSQAKAYLRAYGRAVHLCTQEKKKPRRSSPSTPRSRTGKNHGRVIQRYDFIEKVAGQAGRIPGDTRRHRQEKSQGEIRQAGAIFDNSLYKADPTRGYVKLWGKNPQ